MVDPFTRASPTYQAATRHHHKSGSAWEGYAPRGALLTPRAKACVAVLIIGLTLVAVAMLRGHAA